MSAVLIDNEAVCFFRSRGYFSAYLSENTCAKSHNNISREYTESHRSHSSAKKPNASNRVAIILGFYNGHNYIAEQLRSIFKQSHLGFHIHLSDDLSKKPFDLKLVDLDPQHLEKLSISFHKHNAGVTNNFLNTLASISHDYEYFSFSDQDDIWSDDKLERAIAKLSKIQKNVPALYCSRTEIVNDSCEVTLGLSPLFKKAPSFANALVQNVGGGNTMVFNKAARDLIVASSLNAEVVSHDWWCYQIITGAGGYVIYDPEPCLKYRQHSNNLIGANMSWSARFLRIRELMQGRFRIWNDINIKALSGHKHLLTAENRQVLNTFIEARQSHLLKRIKLFKQSGIYRQTFLGNLGLILAILLNKV